MANLRCLAETHTVTFVWNAPEWSGGEVSSYDFELSLPDGRSEDGRTMGGAWVRRLGSYPVGGEARLSVKVNYEIAGGHEVVSDEATLVCYVGGELPTATLTPTPTATLTPTPTATPDPQLVLQQRTLSADATLSGLALLRDGNGIALRPVFSPQIAEYGATVPLGNGWAMLRPTANHAGATITVDGKAVQSGSNSESFFLHINTPLRIEVEVTAEDGQTRRVYAVTTTHAPVAELEDLSVSSVKLHPLFGGLHAGYRGWVPYSVDQVKVTPRNRYDKGTITVNGQVVVSGQASPEIALGEGENVITVVVTAPDRYTSRSYTITVTRASESASGDATLSGLSLHMATSNQPDAGNEVPYAGPAYQLCPALTAGVYDYRVRLPEEPLDNDLNYLYVTTVATTTAPGAKSIVVSGKRSIEEAREPKREVVSGESSGPWQIFIGYGLITVEVTSLDGIDSETYRVILEQGEVDDPREVALTPGDGSLTLSWGENASSTVPTLYWARWREVGTETWLNKVTLSRWKTDYGDDAPSASAEDGRRMPSTSRSYTISGLNNGTEYEVHLRGTRGGDSSYRVTNWLKSGWVAVRGTPGRATRQLTITPGSPSREYGGTDDLGYTVDGLAGGDTSTDVVSGSLSRAAGEDAGSYAFDMSGLSIATSYADKYVLPSAPTVSDYTITARPVTSVGGVMVNSRPVDGTTDATFDTSAAEGTGVLAAELSDFRAGGLVVSGSFATTTAGTHDVSVTYSLRDHGSFKAANYDLTSTTDTLRGDIAEEVETPTVDETCTITVLYNPPQEMSYGNGPPAPETAHVNVPVAPTIKMNGAYIHASFPMPDTGGMYIMAYETVSRQVYCGHVGEWITVGQMSRMAAYGDWAPVTQGRPWNLGGQAAKLGPLVSGVTYEFRYRPIYYWGPDRNISVVNPDHVGPGKWSPIASGTVSYDENKFFTYGPFRFDRPWTVHRDARRADVSFTADNDLTLESLDLPPGSSITPDFRSNHYDYTVTVPNSVDQLSFGGSFISPWNGEWRNGFAFIVVGDTARFEKEHRYFAYSSNSPYSPAYAQARLVANSYGAKKIRQIPLTSGATTKVEIGVYKWKSGWIGATAISDNTVKKVYTLTVARQLPPLSKPDPVRDLRLSATADSVTVNWQAPADGYPPRHYIVRLRNMDDGKSKTSRIQANRVGFVFANLQGGTTYKVSVRAQNREGKSAWSRAEITLPDAAPLKDLSGSENVYFTAVADVEVETSGDLALTSLELPESVTIEPAFQPDHYNYRLVVPSNVSELSFTGRFATPYRHSHHPYTAYVLVSEDLAVSESAWDDRTRWTRSSTPLDLIVTLHESDIPPRKISLRPGATTTAQIGIYKWKRGKLLDKPFAKNIVKQVYTLAVNQELPSRDNTTLYGLTISAGSLDFSPNTTTYAVNVAYSIDSVTLTPTTSHPEATVSVDGEDPSTPASLDYGENVIEVSVTAADGVATQTYVVTVTRMPPPVPDPPRDGKVKATAESVRVSWKAPESGGSPDYYIVQLRDADDNTVKQVRLGADESTAMFSDLEDGATYTVGVRAGNDGGETSWVETRITLPEATHLGSLAISEGTLDFTSTTTDYAVVLPHTVDSVIITVTVFHPKATVTVNGNGPDTPVSLNYGENVIEVVVTGPDAIETRTYTVSVTRAYPTRPGPPRNVNIETATSSVTVSWQAPGTGDPPDYYMARLQDADGDWSETQVTLLGPAMLSSLRVLKRLRGISTRGKVGDELIVDPAETDYMIHLEENVLALALTPVAQRPSATTITVDGKNVASGNTTYLTRPRPEGTKVVEIRVTEAGTERIYNLTLTRGS